MQFFPAFKTAVIAVLAAASLPACAGPGATKGAYPVPSVQLGPRPFFLVNEMAEGKLKQQLNACAKTFQQYRVSAFSIGHRGAPLQFPEHTRESYEAGARMGAGILECDVAFTKDKELVCRHAQNDLHTTTNILQTALAAKCTTPFQPAVFDASGNLVTPAKAECRTSDITLAEFRTLRGKMDAFNPRGKTVEEFMAGTATFRTDLYSGPTSGTLMTHAESIELFKKLGVKMTPELKTPVVAMPFDGFTQQAYAQKMIDEYKAAGVSPNRVYPQSFLKDDVLYWIAQEPHFGKQAVYLDDAAGVAGLPSATDLRVYKAQGINIWAPPTWALLALDADKNIVPSQAAKDAKAAGLGLITWSLERSGILADGNNGSYYQTIDAAISREGDVLRVIDVLAQGVGVMGIFSDWPATVSFYANCKGL
ncbi:MAG TPA: glycerophosphodiester phosphodiesterase family protein [Ideonella sp.]|uniref:glycerophosphodiester phosphodiesterase family protein n=1 Tax=Ideonella sp. TaxID=1929293 RepID=UPI002E33E473|nr:glycerophosphodiester phosphodiesterase family protein [Ideonella sp.]HEX5688295.1 glycerophosphodiester phosphodiesterase family protein [Ideonella sp.]